MFISHSLIHHSANSLGKTMYSPGKLAFRQNDRHSLKQSSAITLLQLSLQSKYYFVQNSFKWGKDLTTKQNWPFCLIFCQTADNSDNSYLRIGELRVASFKMTVVRLQ